MYSLPVNTAHITEDGNTYLQISTPCLKAGSPLTSVPVHFVTMPAGSSSIALQNSLLLHQTILATNRLLDSILQ